MNNAYEMAIKIGDTISIKKVIVVVIREKDINHVTLEYLNQNNELRNVIIKNNCDEEVIFFVGDFLIYDGESLYKLEGDKLISLNNYKNFTIDKTAIWHLKETAHTLNKEIINFQNKADCMSIRTKKINK